MFRNFENCMATLLEGALASEPVSIRKPALIALANLAVHVKTKKLCSFTTPVDNLLPQLNHVNSCLERLVAGARPDQPEDIRKATLLGLVHFSQSPANRPAMVALGIRELLEGARKKEAFNEISKHLKIGSSRLKGVSPIRPITGDQHKILMKYLDSHSLQTWTVPTLVAVLGEDVAAESLQNYVEKFKSYISSYRYQQGIFSPIMEKLDLIGYEPGDYDTSAKTRSIMHSDSSGQIYILPRNVPTVIFLSIAENNLEVLPGIIFELDFQSKAFVDAYRIVSDLELGENVSSHIVFWLSKDGVKVSFGKTRRAVEKILGDAIEARPASSMSISSNPIWAGTWIGPVFGVWGETGKPLRLDTQLGTLCDHESSSGNRLSNSILMAMFICRQIGAGKIIDLSGEYAQEKLKQLGFNDSCAKDIATKLRELWIAFLVNTPENEVKNLARELAIGIKSALQQRKDV